MRPRTVLIATGAGGFLLLAGSLIWLALSLAGQTDAPPPGRRNESSAPRLAVGAPDDGDPPPSTGTDPVSGVQRTPAGDRAPSRPGPGEALAEAVRQASRIQGRVAEPGGAGLAGATVSLPVAGVTIETITDPSGTFLIDVPPGYRGLLECRLAGRVTPRPRRVCAGDWLTIVLRPGASLHGEVLDADSGASVAGARVAAEAAGRGPSAVTNEAGQFHLSGIRPGAVRLIVDATGYERWSLDSVMVGAIGDESLRIELTRAPPLLGVVVDATTASPIEGATVTHGPASDPDGRLSRSITTDAAGRFSLRAASRIGHVLCARAPGMLPRTMRDLERFDPVQVIQITMLREMQLTGIVQTGLGEPIAGATVTRAASTHPMLAPPQAATTREDGLFRLGGLPLRGRFTLLVQHPSFAPARLPWLDQITIAQPMKIIMTPAARITGTVRSITGEPVPGARVITLFPFPAAQLLNGRPTVAIADEQGRFAVDGLPAGRCVLMARSRALTGPAVSADLVAGQTTDVELQLEESAPIGGRVVSTLGAPVAEALIHGEQSQEAAVDSSSPAAGRWSWSLRSTTSDSGGRFRLAGGREDQPISIDVEAAGYAPARIKAQAGQTDLRVELSPYGALRGRVTDAVTGAPIDRFALDLSSRPESQRMHGVKCGDGSYAHEITSRTGRFLIDQVVAGPYRLRVHAADYHTSDWLPVKASPDPSGAGEITITLQPGGVVQGHVALANGDPVDSMPVCLRPLSANATALWPVVRLTDRAGSFRFGNIDPGRWTIDLGTPDDPFGESRKIELAGDSRVTENWTIDLAVLDIEVRDAFDRPVAAADLLARLDLAYRRTAVTRRGMTDETGHARLDGLLPGNWSLLTRQGSRFVTEEVLIEGTSVHRRTVHLPADR